MKCSRGEVPKVSALASFMTSNWRNSEALAEAWGEIMKGRALDSGHQNSR